MYGWTLLDYVVKPADRVDVWHFQRSTFRHCEGDLSNQVPVGAGNILKLTKQLYNVVVYTPKLRRTIVICSTTKCKLQL